MTYALPGSTIVVSRLISYQKLIIINNKKVYVYHIPTLPMVAEKKIK
jgi:hypothetical protein